MYDQPEGIVVDMETLGEPKSLEYALNWLALEPSIQDNISDPFQDIELPEDISCSELKELILDEFLEYPTDVAIEAYDDLIKAIITKGEDEEFVHDLFRVIYRFRTDPNNVVESELAKLISIYAYNLEYELSYCLPSNLINYIQAFWNQGEVQYWDVPAYENLYNQLSTFHIKYGSPIYNLVTARFRKHVSTHSFDRYIDLAKQVIAESGITNAEYNVYSLERLVEEFRLRL